MGQPTSPLIQALDKIVATCQLNLRWVAYSKDHLAVSGARMLIQQWGVFTRHSRCCWAHVVGNCPHVEVRKFVVTENLYEEEALEGHSHFELLVKMGKAVGLTREQVETAKPLPTTVVALHAWETLTKNRTWYEGLAAKAVLERTNDRKCGNFSAEQGERWMRQLKLTADDVEFWLLHDTVDQVHGGGSFNLLEKYLRSDAEKEAAIRAAEESMMAWKVYLDGVCDAVAGSNPTMELRYGTA
jgi:pyrroloquinoline quinone (PQQ) biosynthesis protein C